MSFELGALCFVVHSFFSRLLCLLGVSSVKRLAQFQQPKCRGFRGGAESVFGFGTTTTHNNYKEQSSKHKAQSSKPTTAPKATFHSFFFLPDRDALVPLRKVYRFCEFAT